MALGEEGDFRMTGFRQVQRFPPQDIFGGAGSVAGREFTTPFGGGLGQPSSLPTQNYLFGDNVNQQYVNNMYTDGRVTNVFNIYGSGTGPGTGPTGGGGTNTITVVGDDGTGTITTYTNISTVEFVGSDLTSVTPSGASTVVVDYSGGGGGGGGGTTLLYGQILSSTKISSTIARWSYQVQLWSNGVTGSTVTAYNTLERNNTSTSAYGYSVNFADGQAIPSTNYKLLSVPTGAYVVLENTHAFSTTGTEYWFSAPNRIDGTC